MIPVKKALNSSVGQKYVMSISGISIVLFVIVHLLGNLTLYSGTDGVAFNQYADALHSLGPLLTVAELGLLAVFLLHIVWAFRISLQNRKARGVSYDQGIRTKGGPSNLSPASRNMFATGVVLLVFLIVHVGNFRFGKYFTERASASEVVVETFKNPFMVVFYVVCIAFLGFHLRHGFWSALQSLGAMKPEWSKAIYTIGLLIGALLALGFLGIPLYVFFFYPTPGV